jgi:hypothetical protein
MLECQGRVRGQQPYHLCRQAQIPCSVQQQRQQPQLALLPQAAAAAVLVQTLQHQGLRTAASGKVRQA